MLHRRFLLLLVALCLFLGAVGLLLGMVGPARFLPGYKVQAQDVHTQDVAVELDGSIFTSTLGYGTTGHNVIGITCTTGTGGYRLMLVSVYWQSVNNPRSISGVTFTANSGIHAGVAYTLTLVGMVDNVSGTVIGRRNAIYRLVGPPYSASGYVTVTFSGYVEYGTVAGVANFKGVDQSTPLGTYVSAVYTDTVSATVTETTKSLTVTTTAGDLVYDTVGLYSATPVGFLTATVGQTELWNTMQPDKTQVRVRGAASTKLATTTTTIMSWKGVGGPTGNRSWALSGVPIKASPTAARLNSLTASAARGGVRVAWETASDVASLGFHVYRATSANGQRERLTASLIPSQAPGSASGSHYQFVDETAQPGVTYYYWLELVGVDGAMELDGPVSARVSLYIKIPPPRDQ